MEETKELALPAISANYLFDDWVEVDLDGPQEDIVELFTYCLDEPALRLHILLNSSNQPINDDTIDVRSVMILWNIFERIGPKFNVMIEHQYVDRTYRDMHSMHIASKHVPYSRFCKRLSFFTSDANNEWFKESNRHEDLQRTFIGSMVIRPITKGKIGHTLLDPSKLNRMPHCWVRTSEFKLYVHGAALHVHAFPFSMQDTETMTCAETVTNNLLEYFSNHFAEYRSMLPSEITRLAHQNGYERSLPSQGLRMAVLSKILLEAGFSPRIFDMEPRPRTLRLDYGHTSLRYKGVHVPYNAQSEDKRLRLFQKFMHYYVQSGLPVIVAMGIPGQTSGHVLICFGHGSAISKTALNVSKIKALNCATDKQRYILDDADLYENYVVMDDNQPPYAWRRFPDLCEIAGARPQYMLVPLYKRMVMEADDARKIAMQKIQDGDTGIFPFLEASGMSSGTEENPLILRVFMATSRSFRAHKVKHPQSELVQAAYMQPIFPKFILVCEIYDQESYYAPGDMRESLGEIVLDGSSLSRTSADSVLLLNYPHFVQYRLPVMDDRKLGITERWIERGRSVPWKKAVGFDHNLSCTMDGAR